MEKFYSLPEVEEITGLKVITLRRYIQSGKLQAFKVGKAYRVLEKDMEALMRGRPHPGPDIVTTMQLRFSDPEHEQAFRDYLDSHGSEDRERLALMYLLLSNADIRDHLADVYSKDKGMIQPAGLKARWQTGESRKVCLLAYNLYNGYTDPEHPERSNPLYLLAENPRIKMDALKIRFQ